MKKSSLDTRLKTYSAIIFGLLAVLCIKLAVVQLFHSDVYQVKAKENRIRLMAIKPSRGEMYDRNGQTLAANELVYTLSLTNPGKDGDTQLVERLVGILQPYYP
ncbi:MAG: penicillin-binding protein 2, partial [Syntrophomonas sp.]|nr:penicillin-binding protein 2 [Syntrophomonas sp.]